MLCDNCGKKEANVQLFKKYKWNKKGNEFM